MNVSPYVQQIIIGVIIVAAVASDRFVKCRRAGDARGRRRTVPILSRQPAACERTA